MLCGHTLFRLLQLLLFMIVLALLLHLLLFSLIRLQVRDTL